MSIVAVTGATGFLGRRLVHELAGRDHRVIALVRAPELCKGVDSLRWSLGEPLPEGLGPIDTLVHVAAHIPIDHAADVEQERCLALNATATSALLRSARDRSVNRVVYVSSGNIYAPKLTPAVEDDPLWPVGHATYYLASKVLAEHYVADGAQRDWFEACWMRPSAMYGPGMRTGVVRRLADRIVAGQQVELGDGGRHAADFVHVDDVAETIATAVERTLSGAVNVGSGVATTVREVAQHLCHALEVDSELIASGPVGAFRATGFTALNIDRAMRLLDHKPRDAATGLAHFVQEDHE